MAENKLISIKKNIKGSLYVVLDDYFGEKLPRTFTLTPDKPEIHVPLNYALSIFNSRATKNMYEQGKFIITKNEDLLTEGLKSEMLLEEEETLTKIKSDAEIIQDLNSGKVEKLLESALQDKVIDVASANLEKLSIETVNKIETATKIAITEE